MKKLFLPISATMGLVFCLFMPNLVYAWNGNYTYISTETGTQVAYVYRNEYKIVDPRACFNSDDLIFILTKIKNISHINSFSFKYELNSSSNNIRRTEYSNTFYPNGDRWPGIISSWNAFDNLPDGSYKAKVYIKINNGGYKYLDAKYFSVGDYYNDYQPDYYRDNYYYDNYSYYFSWIRAGADIRKTGVYSYEIVNSKISFFDDENIRVLTKLANIRNIDHFRVKHEVYLNGNRFYKKAESPIQWPRGNYWSYNYGKADFGKLPVGNHEIRVYLSINDSSYKLVSKKSISVKRKYYNYYDYSYGWSKTDTDVRFVGHYKYDLVHEKSVFYTDENVFVLTKLSNIKGVNTFRVKQELLRNGRTVYKTLLSPNQNPRYDYWEYNYTKNNFGRLPAGNYKIKVYISINHGSYRYLGSTNIEVRQRYGYNGSCRDYSSYSLAPDYYYNWTKTFANNQPYFYPYYYN